MATISYSRRASADEMAAEIDRRGHVIEELEAKLAALTTEAAGRVTAGRWQPIETDAARDVLAERRAWPFGTRVRKIKGSSWQGRVVGHYSTSLTEAGVCVESEREPGSVQIYPSSALETVPDHIPDAGTKVAGDGIVGMLRAQATAARDEALEEAAKVAERLENNGAYRLGIGPTIPEAIRALKENDR